MPEKELHPHQALLAGLPADWGKTTIGALGQIVGGGTPSRAVPSYWDGTIPWLTPGELINGRKILADTAHRINKAGLSGSGAVLLPPSSLMVTTRATIGARAINKVPMATNQGFRSIVFWRPEEANFYYYLLDRLKPELVRRASGTTFLEISGSEFAAVEIPDPPTREKLKIAAVVDALDQSVNAAAAKVVKLTNVRRGLLHDLLTRGLSEEGELRPSPAQAPELYRSTKIGLLPRAWQPKKVESIVVSSVIGPFGSDLVASDYRSEGVPVIFVRDVATGSFLWRSNVYVSKNKADQLSAHSVRAGDVIATKMGLPPCVAVTYPADMPAGIVTADVIRLRPDLKVVLSEWLASYVNFHAVAKQVEQITAGVTRPKVTLRDVRHLVIAVPDTDEQKRILKRLDAMNRNLAAEEETLRKLKRLKVNLADDLLTGRVRVTPLLADAAESALESAG